MKKFLIAILTVFTLGFVNNTWAQKFAHFKYQDVMDTLDTYKDAEKNIKQLEEEFQATMKDLEKEYQTKALALQQEQDSLPEVILQVRYTQLQEIEQLSVQLQQQYEKNMVTVQERYLLPLNDWLKQAVEIVGKRRGIDYILYHQEEGSIFWVNPDKGLDLTNEIITEMLRLEKENPIPIPGQ